MVREWVRRALGGLCERGSVALEREKSVLKQGAVQHLYARLAGAPPHRGHPWRVRVMHIRGVIPRRDRSPCSARSAFLPIMPRSTAVQ